MKNKVGLGFCLAVAFAVLCGGLRAQGVLWVTNGGILSVSTGATLSLKGGITFEDGAVLVNNGRITLGPSGIGNGAGADWTDKSTHPYAYGTGAVLFNSSAPQVIQSVDTFHRIEVNTAGLQLAGDVRCKQWYLVKGVVDAASYHAVVASSADTGIMADQANPGFTRSWINGSLRRYLDLKTVDQYSFPVGPGGNANRVVLENLQATPLTGVSYIDVHFGAKPGDDAGLILSEGGTPYTMVNSGGVWYLTPDTEPGSGAYDLLLYFDGFAGLQDNQFAILRRPDGSVNAKDWAIPAGGAVPDAGSPGRTVASGYARRNGITAFSQFGIGMTQTPLPVIISAFEARRQDRKTVALSWTTATESNDKGFGVELRTDADTVFGNKAFVPSAAVGGSSSAAIDYHYTDTNSYAGISYYRLRQVDQDGRYTYSMIRAVSGDGASSITLLLFPNPSNGQFKIRLEGSDQNRMVRIIDQRGALVRVMTISGGSDLQVGGLKAGAYVIQVVDAFGAGKSFSEKMLILP